MRVTRTVHLIIGLGSLAAGMGLPAGAAQAQTTVSLHALAVPSGTGSLRHAMRVNNGAWSTFRDVEVYAGEIGQIGGVEAAAGAEGLHVIAKTGTDLRGLFHTIRRPNGTWVQFGNVNTQAGDRGPYRYIGMSSGNAGMHVCANSSNGNIWHRSGAAMGPGHNGERQGGRRQQSGHLPERRLRHFHPLGGSLGRRGAARGRQHRQQRRDLAHAATQ